VRDSYLIELSSDNMLTLASSSIRISWVSDFDQK